MAGLLFLAIGLAYLLPEVSSIEIDTPWVFPALLIGLGVCGLLAAFTSRSPASGAAGVTTNADATPRPYVDYDPEPFPDLTLDLAAELAKSKPAPTPEPRSEPSPGPLDATVRPKTIGGAHAITRDDPDEQPPR